MQYLGGGAYNQLDGTPSIHVWICHRKVEAKYIITENDSKR
eukprot:SAG11_NODE_22275_length_409_cov_0.545161_1_plen_40_part_10